MPPRRVPGDSSPVVMDGSSPFPNMSVKPASAGAVRRRLFPWSRTPSDPPSSGAADKGSTSMAAKPTAKPRRVREPRRPFDYAPEARPEQQGALATRLPTRPLRIGLALAGIVIVTASTLVLGGWPGAVDALGRIMGPRFSRSIELLRDVVDLRTLVLGRWLAQSFLVAAALVALSIRGMRRHRKDGRQGRSRAWLAMAIVLFTASVAGMLPIGKLVSTFLVEATGRSIGPEGLGWWVVIAGIVSGLVTLWALVPLHQRLVPGFWLLLGLTGWSAAAAVPWLDAGRDDLALGGACAWVAGAAAMFAAMLTAARGVIREVRGEIKAPPIGAGQGGERVAKAVKVEATKPQPKAPEPVFEPVATTDDGTERMATEESDNGYTDGSEIEEEYASRPLSKAEKKRLRKLGRQAA